MADKDASKSVMGNLPSTRPARIGGRRDSRNGAAAKAQPKPKAKPAAAAKPKPAAAAKPKPTAAAKKAMVRVPLRDGRTLHHDGLGHFGAGRVTLRSAPAGTGIIAGGPMRAIFESLGVADVVTKSVGTSNPYNMIRATFEALKEQASPRAVSQRRGKKVADLLGRSGASAAEAEVQAEAIAE